MANQSTAKGGKESEPTDLLPLPGGRCIPPCLDRPETRDEAITVAVRAERSRIPGALRAVERARGTRALGGVRRPKGTV